MAQLAQGKHHPRTIHHISHFCERWISCSLGDLTPAGLVLGRVQCEWSRVLAMMQHHRETFEAHEWERHCEVSLLLLQLLSLVRCLL